MKKRYDYHSLSEILKIAFVVLLFCLFAISLLFLRQEHSISEWIPIITVEVMIIVASIIGYLVMKHSFLEVSEEGILYHGWRKQLFSPWTEVLEIRAVSRSYKVYTGKGSFTIRQVEPAERTTQGTFLFPLGDSPLGDRRKYTEELIQTIKDNSPNAKFTYSIFNRPLKF